MNDEKFEQQLRKLPSPELPEAWREPILAAALREAEAASRPAWLGMVLWLRGLYGRNPVTTAAMAAMWLLIFFLHAGTPVDPGVQKILARSDATQQQEVPPYVPLEKQIRLVEAMQSAPEQRQMP